MPARTKKSTTRLPQSLLEEITSSSNDSHRRHRSKHQLSRKEARKQEREESKHRRAEYFSKKSKRPAETEHDASPQRKKIKLESPESGKNQTQAKPFKKTETASPGHQSQGSNSVLEGKKPVKQTALEKLVFKASSKPKRTQQEKEEDAYIEYLEAKLGHKKGKSSKYDDGLDDLFDFTSTLTYGGSGDDEDVNETMQIIDGGEDEDEDEDDEEREGEDEDENDESVEGVEEEEWTGIQDSGDSDGEEPEAPSEKLPEPSAPTTRYVPPHLRNKDGQDNKNSEALIKLTRHLKGLLNRMSEQNIGSIVDSIEEVYRNHRRHDVTSTLTTLIIDGICSHSSLLDSYVVLYAAFVCSLHKIIGVEFAAYFIQNVVSSYEKHLSSLQNQDAPAQVDSLTEPTESEKEGKEASNLVVLLSELYNFQVISCVLVYDVIRSLLDGEIHEFKVELLLKIVRNSGHQLRQDDPSALKDIIQIVQTQLAGKEDSISSRTRFMLETLNNLKNNKVKRLGTQNQGGDAVERMKKFLSNLGKKRHVMAHESLRVSLEDLHSAETKGKWWLVGAAWGGDPLVDRQQHQDDTTSKSNVQKGGDTADNLLLKLAKKQGMNTDIRRSIFVVLMSSDDYVDACERLSQLKLTEVQQREIIRVLLHCCGNEKAYNPYYTLVCQHLCGLSHSYKITLQYCLWDFLRSLGESNVGGVEVIKNLKDGGGDEGFDVKSISSTRMRNVAKAYAWWIAKDCITLAVLKPVDFMLLKPQTQTFLRHLFIQLFLSSQSPTPLIAKQVTTRNRAAVEEIFIKGSRIQSLSMGLVFFLSKNFSEEHMEGLEETTVKLVKWGFEVAKETLRVGMDIVPNL
ncbi:hypothetical protein D9758_003658 [Tetrapyrgos nigripes]|uniref:MI domain-containing protein n=1 Tax=Tetrapyrgos nigripes TaxID=182062 RepID=A0A8H5GM19_9AGAR|nr:hypothetical protein D9758_003658 [Tetrapyrgos nigripes]